MPEAANEYRHGLGIAIDLSGDFDTELSPEDCLENVVFNLKPRDIVVFHDSEKAFDRLAHVLPRVLAHCKKQGWSMQAILPTDFSK